MQQPVVERIEARSELQIRLVNIAQTRSCALGNKRADPVRVRIAQCSRAKRINVDRDCSWHETKIRARKWPVHLARVPTVIESAIG